MGRKKIPLEDLQAEVGNILREYAKDVDTAVDKAAVQEAKVAQRELREQSPKQSGHYSKGWAYAREKEKHSTRVTVYNKTDYRLTHLLENGHVTRNGTGRTYGRTPAHVHIAPVEAEVIDHFEAAIAENLDR